MKAKIAYCPICGEEVDERGCFVVAVSAWLADIGVYVPALAGRCAEIGEWEI